MSKGIIGSTNQYGISIRLIGYELTAGNTDDSHGYISGAKHILSHGWHFCVIKVDATTNITMYVDTVQVATGGLFAWNSDAAFNRLFYSQSPVHSTMYLNGDVDQIRVFSELTDDEQDVLYNGGIGC